MHTYTHANIVVTTGVWISYQYLDCINKMSGCLDTVQTKFEQCMDVQKWSRNCLEGVWCQASVRKVSRDST